MRINWSDDNRNVQIVMSRLQARKLVTSLEDMRSYLRGMDSDMTDDMIVLTFLLEALLDELEKEEEE